jgi:hypothetical protein
LLKYGAAVAAVAAQSANKYLRLAVQQATHTGLLQFNLVTLSAYKQEEVAVEGAVTGMDSPEREVLSAMLLGVFS